MPDVQARFLFSLCSYNFIAANKAYEVFKSVILRMETLQDNIVFNEELIVEDDFEPFIKWLCISLMHYFTGDNE